MLRSFPLSPIMLSDSASYLRSLMIDDDKPKVDLAHLYCHKQYAVEIIQLIEVPPPSRRFPSSPIDPSSIASSSSCCSYSDSESDYTSDYDDDAESVGPSYCSSDNPGGINDEQEEISTPDETYDTRVIRVHAWRESFAKAMSLIPSSASCLPQYKIIPPLRPILTVSDTPPTKPAKRKADDENDNDDESVSNPCPSIERSQNFTHNIELSLI